jgi:hypothetical protein
LALWLWLKELALRLWLAGDMLLCCVGAAGTSRRMPFGRQTVRPPPRPFKAKEAGELGLPVGRDKQDTQVVVLNTHK